ncbi:MAG TPA: hypothetical protein VM407_14465 [Acidovorax sp.]|jgi:hypothetical protein|nr:hypothetical protein [Acidovorax sp.]
MKNTILPTIRLLVSGATAALLLGLAGGAHAQAYVNATVGGELAPGVYGRINIGNAPPPPLIYAEPIIIQRPAVVVPRAPIYMYVPPGHAKNWAKHCARYNACSQPVYFVQEPPPRRVNPYPGPRGRDDQGWDDDRGRGGKYDRDHDRGHGRGKGHGHRD